MNREVVIRGKVETDKVTRVQKVLRTFFTRSVQGENASGKVGRVYRRVADSSGIVHYSEKRKVRKLSLAALSFLVPTSANTVLAQTIGGGVEDAYHAVSGALNATYAAIQGEVPTSSINTREQYDSHNYAFPAIAGSIILGNNSSNTAGITYDPNVPATVKDAPVWKQAGSSFNTSPDGTLSVGSIRHVGNLMAQDGAYYLEPGQCAYFQIQPFPAPEVSVSAITSVPNEGGLVMKQADSNGLDFCDTSAVALSTDELSGIYLQFNP